MIFSDLHAFFNFIFIKIHFWFNQTSQSEIIWRYFFSKWFVIQFTFLILKKCMYFLAYKLADFFNVEKICRKGPSYNFKNTLVMNSLVFLSTNAWIDLGIISFSNGSEIEDLFDSFAEAALKLSADITWNKELIFVRILRIHIFNLLNRFILSLNRRQTNHASNNSLGACLFHLKIITLAPNGTMTDCYWKF